MNILISGGLGFIGSNVLELLLKNNKINKIFILDNNSISLTRFYIPIKNYDKVRVINFDISKKIDLKISVDCILHLAAAGNVIDSVKDPLGNLKNNVLATLQILEFAKNANISKFIFSSTGGALMGNSTPPVNESSNPKPISPYGASKLSCEGYINAYSSMYNFQSYTLRFGNVFGPYCFHKKGVVNKLFESNLKNKVFKIFGDGTSSRDYIFSKDIANAIEKCIFAKSKNLNNIYHLSTGLETSLNKLVDIFSEVSKYKLQVEYLPSRVGEVYRNFADYSKAKNELNFEPNKDISLLIKETFNWYKSFSSK